MIYSVKDNNADYEQVNEVIVIADNKTEALELAKKEFDLAKEWYFPWKEQTLEISEIDSTQKRILLSVMA